MVSQGSRSGPPTGPGRAVARLFCSSARRGGPGRAIISGVAREARAGPGLASGLAPARRAGPRNGPQGRGLRPAFLVSEDPNFTVTVCDRNHYRSTLPVLYIQMNTFTLYLNYNLQLSN